jgi:hypothetical protein
MKRSFSLLTVVLIGFSFIAGCDSGENKVILPGDVDQSEQALQNEAALKEAATNPPKTTDPKKPDFSGN